MSRSADAICQRDLPTPEPPLGGRHPGRASAESVVRLIEVRDTRATRTGEKRGVKAFALRRWARITSANRFISTG
jgi:hypothetical protein